MKKWFIILSALLLALLLLYAAIYKLYDYKTFVSQLNGSPLLHNYSNILAWLVPGIEIIIAGLLFYPRTRLIGLYSSFFLMLFFTVYVYVLPRLYTNPGCSCGGIISKLSWQGHFYFNLFFTLMAGAAVSIFPVKKSKALAYK
jgi:hypothetical protein